MKAMTVIQIVLITSFATSTLSLLLWVLKIGPTIPLSLVMLVAMFATLISNLVYAFACAISWIKWFARKKNA